MVDGDLVRPLPCAVVGGVCGWRKVVPENEFRIEVIEHIAEATAAEAARRPATVEPTPPKPGA